MFALAGDALGSGGSVVLEGNMRVGEHEGAITRCSRAHPVFAACRCCVRWRTRCDAPHGRRREPVRHAGHLDAITSFSGAAGAFLDIPSIRLEIDGSESSQARERLFAALDVSLQHAA
jgi:hypothetical protein